MKYYIQKVWSARLFRTVFRDICDLRKQWPNFQTLFSIKENALLIVIFTWNIYMRKIVHFKSIGTIRFFHHLSFSGYLIRLTLPYKKNRKLSWLVEWNWICRISKKHFICLLGHSWKWKWPLIKSKRFWRTIRLKQHSRSTKRSTATCQARNRRTSSLVLHVIAKSHTIEFDSTETFANIKHRTRRIIRVPTM